jgi:hypothetical protein
MKITVPNTIVLSLVLAGSTLTLVAAEPATNRVVVAREYMKPAHSRTFEIHYVGIVSAVPADTRTLRVWMPVPQSSTVQSISNVTFTMPPQLNTETEFGNQIAFWEFKDPGAELELGMSFVCERKEVIMDLERLADDGTEAPDQFTAFLRAERLVLVDDEIRGLSRGITVGKTTTLEKARAIYDHVTEHVTYDKNHVGWGFGSTRHACDVGKGNCTDFHALFNSLCRAEGIASSFEIGLYLPYQKGSNEPLGSYHCWAFFRVPGKTWVPVDCSEADQISRLRDYFFGGHTSNRVALSIGRDLVLNPPQSGEPLNYFLNPYAEADGLPVKTEKSWSFRDLD